MAYAKHAFNRSWAWTACAAVGLLLLAACADEGGQDAADETGSETEEVAADEVDPDQGYPVDAITFLVGSGPGSGMDNTARTFLEYLGPELDVDIVVENVEGAGASLAMAELYTAPADGSVIALGGSNALTAYPQVNDDLPYDSWEDFTMLGEIAVNPMVLVSNPDSGLDDLDAVIRAAQERPGELTVSQPGDLSAPGFGIELLSMAADIELNSVPISGGGGEARTEVVAGRAELGVGGASLYQGQVEAGDLTPVAALWEERLSAYPDTPTASEQGVDAVYAAYFFFVAPDGLDPAIAEMLHNALLAVSTTSEYVQRIDDLGSVVRPLSIEETEAQLREIAESASEILGRIEARG